MCPTGQQSMTKQTKLYTPRWIGLAVPCRVPPRSLLCDSEIVWFYPVLVVCELSSLTFCLRSCNKKTARKAGDTASHAQIEPAKEVMKNNDSRTHGDQRSKFWVPCTSQNPICSMPEPQWAATLWQHCVLLQCCILPPCDLHLPLYRSLDILMSTWSTYPYDFDASCYMYTISPLRVVNLHSYNQLHFYTPRFLTCILRYVIVYLYVSRLLPNTTCIIRT